MANYKHPAHDTNDALDHGKDELGDKSDFAQNNFWRKLDSQHSLDDLMLELE